MKVLDPIAAFLERCDRSPKKDEAPKPCGKGWTGTKPPGCKRKKKESAKSPPNQGEKKKAVGVDKRSQDRRQELLEGFRNYAEATKSERSPSAIKNTDKVENNATSRKKAALQQSLDTAKEFKASPTQIKRIKEYVGNTYLSNRGEKWEVQSWLPPFEKGGDGEFSIQINGGRRTGVSTSQLNKWVTSGFFKDAKS